MHCLVQSGIGQSESDDAMAGGNGRGQSSCTFRLACTSATRGLLLDWLDVCTELHSLGEVQVILF